MVENKTGFELIPTGTEKILIVDDEERSVSIMKTILERLGYNVTTMTSSLKALELFKQDPSRYVDTLFEELVRFSGSNLRHEERLIVRHKHDGRDNHKDEHHDMIDLLRDLQRRFKEARNQPAADNMKFRRSG